MATTDNAIKSDKRTEFVSKKASRSSTSCSSSSSALDRKTLRLDDFKSFDLCDDIEEENDVAGLTDDNERSDDDELEELRKSDNKVDFFLKDDQSSDLDISNDRECKLVPLSSIKRLQREPDIYFVDDMIPVEFAELLETSPFPLLTSKQIADSRSIHTDTANIELNSGVATWSIIARMLYTYEKSEGVNPPPPMITLEEQLTENIGGQFMEFDYKSLY